MTTNREVKCWSAPRQTFPVSGLSNDIVSVALPCSSSNCRGTLEGSLFAMCVLTSSGGVKCKGSNVDGQLGDGTQTDRTSFVDVQGLTSGVASISADWGTICAVLTNGGLKCWGKNDYGQIGDGTKTTKSVPTNVLGLTSGVKSVSTGFLNSCAILSDGSVKCWGYNYFGQLGDGTTQDSSTPVDVLGSAK